ncbi:TniB family NTP-binding protein (plasmid) [Ralstonia solanacearum]|uniref:TniB family NTP-binding protein n=1 Tax=Ralstonia solanacearum TaxID=305 RepID=UPI003217D282
MSIAHLAPEARAALELPDEQRIAFLAEDRWIDYPRARKALRELEHLLTCPQRTRMPSLLIHGESNIGKSMIIQKFLRDHPRREFNHDTGMLQLDVLAVEMPSAPTERRFYGQLLLAMNAPYRPSDRLAAVEFTALTLLRQVGPKMIVVDEVHNLLAGSAREQRASLNLLKFLSNQVPCSIVALGTRDALAAVQTDPQIASRFPGLELPRWQENEDLRGFLAGFERQLPLRKPSRLSDNRTIVSGIMSATGGVTGEITALLSHAAEAAIRTQTECITPELLQVTGGKVRFHP